MSAKLKEKEMNAASHKKHSVILTAVLCIAVIGIGALIALNSIGNSSQGPSLPESRNLFTLYDTYNMTVVVVFDEEPPIVQFVAPDENLIDMDNIRYRPGSNFIQYFLPNAMPGIWRMYYDPLSNTEISTPYSVYMEHIFIRDFEMHESQTSNDADIDRDISVSFVVSADDAGEFNYELHAVFTASDNSIAEEVLLVKGYGPLNEELILSANTDDIRDMGGFMLRLTAYVRHGQASIRDTAWIDLR